MSDLETENQPLLSGRAAPSTSTRRWFGIGCILSIMFLQSLFLVKLYILLRKDLDYFNLSIKHIDPRLIAIGMVCVFAPIVTAVYADAFSGCYKATFVGLCTKTLGNMLGLIVSCLCEAVDYKTNQTLRLFLIGVFAMSVFFVVGGISFTPAFIVLSCQQAKPTRESASSVISWLLFFGAVGTAISYVVFDDEMVNILSFEDSPFFRPILHVVTFGVDALSLALFVFGKRSYSLVPTDEGHHSFKGLLKRCSRYLRCLPGQAEGNDQASLGVFPSAVEIQLRKTLARQTLRKFVFMVPLSCSIAALFMSLAFANQIDFNPGKHVDHIFRLLEVGVFIIVIPIIECIRKKTRFHFWQNNPANQLKCVGFCFIDAALCLIMYGIVNSFTDMPQTQMPSTLWNIPMKILKGVAILIISINVFVFCFHESPPGLSTSVTALVGCIVMIDAPIYATFRSAISSAISENNVKIVSSAAAGVLIAIFVIIYIPVSIWYIRTVRKIREINNSLEEITASSNGHMESVLRGTT